MSVLLWIVGIAAVGFFLFHRAAKGSLNKQLRGAVSAVQAATCMRLMRRYETRFDKDRAIDLAVAVTNSLFGNKPVMEKALVFKKTNATLIDRCLRELKDDQDLRIAVTDANRVLAASSTMLPGSKLKSCIALITFST